MSVKINFLGQWFSTWMWPKRTRTEWSNSNHCLGSPAPVAEPEPTPGDESMEADNEAMESDETSAPELVAAEAIRIPDAQFEHYNRVYNRADLRAREELLKMEANCFMAIEVAIRI